MTLPQASAFITKWSVVDQHTDSVTGLSATVFEEVATGKRYLAIRGTEASGADLTADGLLALGLPSNLNPQFTALKAQLDIWLADPSVLKDQSFTVAGHSLGGYLAAAVKQTYPQVTDAYLFNAPGVGGVLGNLTDVLTSALGLSSAPTGNIWNVRGSESFPLISGLGYQLGTAISIRTEAALNNHGIVGLTDALALQTLYSQLAPSLGQAQLNALIDASGSPMSQTLESALDALRTIFLGPDTPPTSTGDRDALYANLHALQGDAAYIALADSAQLTLLAGPSASDIAMQAKVDNAQGLAARYALVALNPFVLIGADYSAFNSQGELNLYDPATGTGAITPQYLADRFAFLKRKLWFSTEDKNPVDPSIVFDPDNDAFQNEEAYYEDVATGYKIQQGGLFNNTHHYFFGGEGDDVATGAAVADHLYGGAGDDTLTGGGGNDYLEGGIGNDTYLINPGDGFDTVLDTDGQGVIQFGAVEARGSAGLDPAKWIHAAGSDTWIDQVNNITYTKIVDDGETRLLIRKGDATVLVEGWSADELGIGLGDGAAAPPPAPPTVLAGDLLPDYLAAATGGQRVEGLAGADMILGSGASGADHLLGGDGDDCLQGHADTDYLVDKGGDFEWRMAA